MLPHSPSTTGRISEVIECLSNVRKTVEAELNEKYQRSMSPLMLPARKEEPAFETQRLWTAY